MGDGKKGDRIRSRAPRSGLPSRWRLHIIACLAPLSIGHPSQGSRQLKKDKIKRSNSPALTSAREVLTAQQRHETGLQPDVMPLNSQHSTGKEMARGVGVGVFGAQKPLHRRCGSACGGLGSAGLGPPCRRTEAGTQSLEVHYAPALFIQSPSVLTTLTSRCVNMRAQAQEERLAGKTGAPGS